VVVPPENSVVVGTVAVTAEPTPAPAPGFQNGASGKAEAIQLRTPLGDGNPRNPRGPGWSAPRATQQLVLSGMAHGMRRREDLTCVTAFVSVETGFSGGSVSSEGWHVQWESVPPG
jgi:hypothetical protein